MLRRKLFEIFIGGFKCDTPQKSIQTYFKKFGDIKIELKMKRKSKNVSLGYCVLRTHDKSIYGRLINQRRFKFEDRTIECKPFLKEKELEDFYSDFKQRRLQVYGIPPELSNKRLAELFSAFGVVQNAYRLVDYRSLEEQGNGFVLMEKKEAAKKIEKMKQIKVGNIFLKVRLFTKDVGLHKLEEETASESFMDKSKNDGKDEINQKNSGKNLEGKYDNAQYIKKKILEKKSKTSKNEYIKTPNNNTYKEKKNKTTRMTKKIDKYKHFEYIEKSRDFYEKRPKNIFEEKDIKLLDETKSKKKENLNIKSPTEFNKTVLIESIAPKCTTTQITKLNNNAYHGLKESESNILNRFDSHDKHKNKNINYSIGNWPGCSKMAFFGSSNNIYNLKTNKKDDLKFVSKKLDDLNLSAFFEEESENSQKSCLEQTKKGLDKSSSLKLDFNNDKGTEIAEKNVQELYYSKKSKLKSSQTPNPNSSCYSHFNSSGIVKYKPLNFFDKHETEVEFELELAKRIENFDVNPLTNNYFVKKVKLSKFDIYEMRFKHKVGNLLPGIYFRTKSVIAALDMTDYDILKPTQASYHNNKRRKRFMDWMHSGKNVKITWS